MRNIIRDWLRGYSDADYASMLKKLASPELREPGSMLTVTRAEMLAYHAMLRAMQ